MPRCPAVSDARNPVYTLLESVTQTGYRRTDGGYDSRSLPPVEFEYTKPAVQEEVREVDPTNLENLPVGLDGSAYRWTDLHGEGIAGILTEQAGAWFYKRNRSPLSNTAQFAPLETVALKPNVVLGGGAEFMDLAGDGQLDVVVFEGLTPGLYEHDDAEGWQPFRPFISRLNRDLRDPNLRFIDLDGDGHADVLITEDDAFIWHASLAETGFGPTRRVSQALEEEEGPRIVFADGTQSIYLADLSGDGLTDIVRIRNGEVCYWSNQGHARFGAKVTMDNAPWFDHPDQFDPRRIRLVDIDGSGTTDIIYLHGDGVRLYFNRSGNSWSQPQVLKVFPPVDYLASIVPTDLLGNGTACLVWSSPLPGNAPRPMRYVNLMGKDKPHLLIKTINNLGAETHVHYAPSTKFYLLDKHAGTPWITRLPFPVHVVERVETYDHISRNRFVTRYAYHHDYFDGDEREFSGFGMVEQWDTEQFSTLTAGGTLPAENIAAASHVPPVHTKTWFHTGVYLGGNRVVQEVLRVRALLSRVGSRTWFELWLLFTIGVLFESLWRVACSRDAANRQLERNTRNQELSDLLSDKHEYGVHELLNKQPKTDEEFAAWLKAEDEWLKSVLAIMREYGCTKQQIRHVHTLGIIQMIPLHPEPLVSHQLSMLATWLTRIADTAREYGE